MNNRINQRSLFTILFTVNFCISFGFCMTDSFFSIYYKDLGAEGLLLGLSVAVYQFSKVIIGPFAGKVARNKGYLNVLIFGLFMYFIVSLIFITTNNLYIIMLSRIIQGAATAIFRPVIYGLLSTIIPQNKSSELLGTFDIAFYSSLALAPVVGGFLKDMYGINGIFYFLPILCAIAFLIMIITFIKYKDVQIIESPNTHKVQHSRKEYSMYIFIFGKSFSLSCFTIYYPIFLLNNGFSDRDTGLMLSCSAIGMCLFVKPMGRLADIFSKPLMVFLGGSAFSLIYLNIPTSNVFFHAALFSFFCGVFGAMSQPAGLSLLMKDRMLLDRASILGTFNSVMGVGFATGSIISSVIVYHYSIEQAFKVSGVISLLSSWLFYNIINDGFVFPKILKLTSVDRS